MRDLDEAILKILDEVKEKRNKDNVTPKGYIPITRDTVEPLERGSYGIDPSIEIRLMTTSNKAEYVEAYSSDLGRWVTLKQVKEGHKVDPV